MMVYARARCFPETPGLPPHTRIGALRNCREEPHLGIRRAQAGRRGESKYQEPAYHTLVLLGTREEWGALVCACLPPITYPACAWVPDQDGSTRMGGVPARNTFQLSRGHPAPGIFTTILLYAPAALLGATAPTASRKCHVPPSVRGKSWMRCALSTAVDGVSRGNPSTQAREPFSRSFSRSVSWAYIIIRAATAIFPSAIPRGPYDPASGGSE